MPYFFLKCLYIWTSLCSSLIYNLYKLKFGPMEEEWSFILSRKTLPQQFDPKSQFFFMGEKKNITSKQIILVITCRLYDYVVDRNLNFPFLCSAFLLPSPPKRSISPPRSTCYTVVFVIALGLPRWCQWKRTCLPVQETYETRVQSLNQEDSLEERMATHSSIRAWTIPWTEEPGGLQSIGPHSQTQLK